MTRPTVVLLHGIGSAASVWTDVLPFLEPDVDAVPLDLVGHGGRRLPYGVPPTPAALAEWVVEDLDERGLGRVHVAGHSLGGWVAVELARLGRARSVTAVAPGGLWRDSMPRRTELLLRGGRLGARAATHLPSEVVARAEGSPAVTWVEYRLAVHDPARLPAGATTHPIEAMATADGFGDVLRAARHLRLDATDLDVPLTVLFGRDDAILPARSARERDRLPPQTRWLELPRVGHVVPAERPAEVARVVVETVREAESARPARPATVDLSAYGFDAAPLLPESTRDDLDAAGEAESDAARLARLSAERPPHWS